MPVTASCPDLSILRQFTLGQLPAEELEPLARHVDQCDRCARSLEGMKDEDTLLLALSTQATVSNEPLDEGVGHLIERLKGLLPPTASPGVEEVQTTVTNAPPSKGDGLTLPTALRTESTEALHDFLTPPEGPWEIGRLGSYRVLKLLGVGGMGLVFQAEDTQLRRLVALKVMKPEMAKKAAARERFLREARAAAQLKSDHVVTIHQVSEERQVVFLAMEFLEGLSLEELLKRGQRPTLAEAARIGRQIALGLQAAHTHGLIHRDVKPGNVWLEGEGEAPAEPARQEPRPPATSPSWRGGRVKLLDFGLARVEAEDEHHLTQSGAIVGTPGYMAPEQARSEEVDARADLFSLGVVLYRLTTGQLPFRGHNTMAVLTALALDTPTPPRAINPDISPRLAALIDRLLCKDREGRPATAQAVADELAAIERESATTVLPAAALDLADAPTITMETKAAPVSPAVKPQRRGWRLVAVAAGLLLLAGLCAAIIVIIRDKQGNEVARIEVPKGGSVETKEREDDKGKEEPKKQPAPKEGVRIEPAPLGAVLPGEPLTQTALVQQPAKLPGVRSWTIETRAPWGPYAPVLAYRPDGKRLAAGTQDGVIRIFEPQTGRLVQVLLGEGRPYALAWSPDGRGLAALITGQKHLVRLWDAERGRVLWAIDVIPPGQGASAIAWSADGRSVLVCAESCLALDAAQGKITHQVPLPCWGGAFSPDRKRVAGIHRQGDGIFVWDTATGEVVRKLGEHKGAVAWSPDGKRLTCVGDDALRVWEAGTGKEIIHRKDLANKGRGIVSWSPDGRTLALTHEPQQRARLVEVAADAKWRELDGPHEEMAWSPDSKTIALAEAGLYLHDVATGKQLRSLWEPQGGPGINGFALSPDGQTLAMMGGDQQTLLSSVDTGQVFMKLEGTTWPLAWSPDGRRLAAGGPNHAVLLWENGGKVRVPLSGHAADVTALAWSADGKRLASAAAGEKRVLVWDADKAERFREVGPLAGAVQWWGWPDFVVVPFTWSPDGRLLAFDVQEIGWHVWDVEQNKLANDPKEWKGWRFELAPDGRSALQVPGQGDLFYRLRDLATGQERGQLPHCPGGHPSAWSPDGHLLAVPGFDGIELWRADLRSRARTLRLTCSATLGGVWPTVVQIAFSGDGKLVAARAGERLHLWETDTGRLRGILLGQYSLTIAADGHYTGNEQVERGIVMVVQKDDGTQEVLEPADFEQKYGFKNEPDKVHLLQPLPPSLTVSPGQPLGPHALVREPAELPDANATSWTVETRNARHLVRAVAYRPDGKLLATGGDDGTIRLWDPAKGELVRMLVGDPVHSLSWSPNGKILAACSYEFGASLWEADTGRLLRRPTEGGRYAAWSPDGRTLAFVADPEVRLWDTVTEQLVVRYILPSFGQSISWSPDGKTLAIGLADKTLRLWDVASGKETRKLEGHGGLVSGVAWSPDGKQVVSVAQEDRAFRVWDAATGKPQGRFAVDRLWGATPALWSPDGMTVATGFATSLGLFDPHTGRLIHSFEVGQIVQALAWSPDGKQVATAGSHGVHLHDASGKRTHTLEESNNNGSITSLAWSPDNQRLAIGWQVGALRIVEAATGRRRAAPPNAYAPAAWSPDGKTFAARIDATTMGLWDTVTNRLVRRLEGEAAPQPLGALAWSADSKHLAAGYEQRVWVWSAETGKLLWQNDKHYVSGVAWSPDGRQLATTDGRKKIGKVRIWEAGTGKLLLETTPLQSWRLAWSPGGKALAVQAQEEGGAPIAALIDAASGAVRAKARANVAALRWSSDGKSFVTFDGRDHGIHVSAWDGTSGKQLRTAGPFWTPLPLLAAWSPHGRRLAWTGGHEVALYQADGQLLGVLLPFDIFGYLAVTADGRYRGNARVERQIMMVVQKRNGTSETLTPAEFEQKYGFKNDPAKVRLTE